MFPAFAAAEEIKNAVVGLGRKISFQSGLYI
jgi:hypothetical protein